MVKPQGRKGKGSKLYRKGSRCERKARRILEAQGYQVMRSAGSKGVFDLHAIGPHDVILIQIKANKPPGPSERERIKSFVVPPNVRKEIWIFYDGKRSGPQILTSASLRGDPEGA